MADFNPSPQNRSLWKNPLYFGIFFLTLVTLSFLSLHFQKKGPSSLLFFFVYAMGQAAFETSFLMSVGRLICVSCRPFWFSFYIGLTFLCLCGHLVDFLLHPILNASLFRTVGFLIEESPTNILHLLDASGLSLWFWAGIFASFLLLPLVGVLLYRLTYRIWTTSQVFPQVHQYALLFTLPLLLLVESILHPYLPQESYHLFCSSLPWKKTLLCPAPTSIALFQTLALPKKEKLSFARIESSSSELPNIYLFVVDSLRKDVIQEAYAPGLARFQKEEAIPIQTSLSNANATHLSWFSLFHSNHPLYWKHIQNYKENNGSPALEILKKLGYKICVYSSANLSYYGMEKLLFGQEIQIHSFPHPSPQEAWKSDTATVEQFSKDIANPAMHRGHCFIFFWDATHFRYSWPHTMSPPFTPVANFWSYLNVYGHSKTALEQIKNSYRNAVYFIDNLFQTVRALIPNPDEAYLIFTADHGEELLDHGYLFHLSHLSNVQTEVPLLMKLGRKEHPSSSIEICSHIDVFPTVLDALQSNSFSPSILKGKSLYKNPHTSSYALMAQYNAGRTPYEFCLHNGRCKLMFRFANRKNVFESRSIEVVSLRTAEEEILSPKGEDLSLWIEKEFGEAFEELFPLNGSLALPAR